MIIACTKRAKMATRSGRLRPEWSWSECVLPGAKLRPIAPRDRANRARCAGHRQNAFFHARSSANTTTRSGKSRPAWRTAAARTAASEVRKNGLVSPSSPMVAQPAANKVSPQNTTSLPTHAICPEVCPGMSRTDNSSPIPGSVNVSPSPSAWVRPGIWSRAGPKTGTGRRARSPWLPPTWSP